ncbi:hypothetical protein WM019_04845 [Bifidobacterium mongoliense]|jgi:hypothetical protein
MSENVGKSTGMKPKNGSCTLGSSQNLKTRLDCGRVVPVDAQSGNLLGCVAAVVGVG